ncbi:hypothetical protein [Shimia abyssi]|uniref:hypothetical protein n=1 Tax=Shimia abyssi TaxID=1662395 RepID=UPI0013FDAFC7|nr:hypothetical protein [Shimia abyssi]
MPLRLAVLRYDNALQSAVFGIEEMLSFAGSLSNERQMSVSIIDEMACGYDVYVLPPATKEIEVDVGCDLPERLKQEHTRGALLCSVCAGLAGRGGCFGQPDSHDALGAGAPYGEALSNGGDGRKPDID